MLQSILARLRGADLTARNARFLRDMHRQMDATVPAGATVFLGDSHTYGLVTSTVVHGGVKFGTGGQTSGELLEEMRGLSCLARASRIVVMTGTNDVLQGSVDGLEAAYRAILAAVPAGVPVIMSSIPPLQAPDLREPARRAAEAARSACAADPRCTFVDAHAALSSDGKPLPGVLWDGVHLSSEGYRIWAALLRRALTE
jgi:lysophospholipase L1-like esterase